MLFVVPGPDEAPPASARAKEGSGVTIDDSGLPEGLLTASKGYDAAAKVELDLEGAPFLIDEEPEKPTSASLDEAAASLDKISAADSRLPAWAEKYPGLYKRLSKRNLGIGAVVLLLLIAGGYFLRSSPPDVPASGQRAAQPEPAAPPEVQTPPQQHAFSFDPFWVEQTDSQGNTRFLIFKFTAVAKEEKVRWEAGNKTLALRDAIFYYLKHKNLTFLSDKKNVEAMKSDLLVILNEHLSSGSMDAVLIESYLIK